MIDRFDVRAHLDEIAPKAQSGDEEENEPNLDWDDRQANYERFRTLVQNDFMGSACFIR